MKLLPTLFLLALCCNCWSQFSLSHHVIAFGSMDVEQNGNTMCATLGEQIAGDLLSSNTILLQGFQQGRVEMLTSVDFSDRLHLDVYPNPTSDFIWMELSGQSSQIKYRVINVLGYSFLQGTVSTGRHILDLRKLTSGVYWIQFFDGLSTHVQSIIKN